MNTIKKANELFKDLAKGLRRIDDVPESDRENWFLTNESYTRVYGGSDTEVSTIADYFDQVACDAICVTGKENGMWFVGID